MFPFRRKPVQLQTLAERIRDLAERQHALIKDITDTSRLALEASQGDDSGIVWEQMVEASTRSLGTLNCLAVATKEARSRGF